MNVATREEEINDEDNPNGAKMFVASSYRGTGLLISLQKSVLVMTVGKNEGED